MTGNNLTYALIPRLSRGILSHRPSRSLARRDYFIIFVAGRGIVRARDSARIRRCDSPPSLLRTLILTRWSAVPDDGALARRPGRGGSRGAAPHSGDRARESTHSISARRSMRRRRRRRCRASRSPAPILPPETDSLIARTQLPLFLTIRANSRTDPPEASPPPLRARARPISEKESLPACAREIARTNEIGMQTYKLPWTVRNQLSTKSRRRTG